MARTKEQAAEYMRQLRSARTPEQVEAQRKKDRDWKVAKRKEVGTAYTMLHAAKNRAKRKGLTFALVLEDIQIPSKCPILGIKLSMGEGKHWDGSPSLDRIDPSKGYTPENVWVISLRANRIKNDSTPHELFQLARAIAAKAAHGLCDIPETFVASFVPA